MLPPRCFGRAMNLLSIQSHVAYGHVGNAAATFPLQRIGVEVWPVHTVQFSNHTGYGAWTGRVFEAGLITELVRGIAERGVLVQCDGVLSGYMGSAETGAAILDAVAQVKAVNGKARYCCDPVSPSRPACFVRPAFLIHAEQAVPAADIVTPNSRADLSPTNQRDAADAPCDDRCLHALGPKPMVTSCLHTGDSSVDRSRSSSVRPLPLAHASCPFR